MQQGPRVLVLGNDSIEDPVYGGEQRSYWLTQIYSRNDIDFEYVHSDSFMAYFRPAKRGWARLLDPFEALRRRIPLSLIRKLGHRARAAAELHAHLRDDLKRIESADVIVFDHPFAYPFFESMLAGKRVVYSSHNVESKIIGDYFRRIQPNPAERKRLEERITRVEDALTSRADLVVACTDADAMHYRRRGGRNVVVAPNGALRLAPLDDRQLADSPFERYVLFVSSAWNPNVAGLLRYCRELTLPEGRGLVCAGAIGGSTYPGFEALRENPSIAFTGPLSNERIAALAHFAHALIVPALDAGGSNIKTAQAMLTRKAILATPQAFRGYEEFETSAGVELCRTPAEFQERIAKHLEREPTEFDRPEADRALWPNALKPAEKPILALLEKTTFA